MARKDGVRFSADANAVTMSTSTPAHRAEPPSPRTCQQNGFALGWATTVSLPLAAYH